MAGAGAADITIGRPQPEFVKKESGGAAGIRSAARAAVSARALVQEDG
jgi:hypothetical protein